MDTPSPKFRFRVALPPDLPSPKRSSGFAQAGARRAKGGLPSEALAKGGAPRETRTPTSRRTTDFESKCGYRNLLIYIA